MIQLKQDIKRTPQLFFGFIFLAVGIMLMKRSNLGMASWGVFHQGLSRTIHLPFGVITQLLGLIILIISVLLLKTKVGIGTICNVVFVGLFIDLSDHLFTFVPSTTLQQSILLMSGILSMTFGRSIYISSQLGEGPRDGLFVGITRVTGWQVKYVKPAIEFTILVAGYLLGGVVGVGTVIAIVMSGYLVQLFLRLFHFDPSHTKQHHITEYFNNANTD